MRKKNIMIPNGAWDHEETESLKNVQNGKLKTSLARCDRACSWTVLKNTSYCPRPPSTGLSIIQHVMAHYRI
jgi:hypothetical protein